MTNPKTKISDKAQLATDHYIANCIITPIVGYTWARAMKEAGYAASTINKASNNTWGLLGVQSQINKARADIKASSIATRADRQEFWTSVYLGTLKDAEGNPVAMGMNDRLRASELLGKSEADFIDVLKTENKVLGINVNVKG